MPVMEKASAVGSASKLILTLAALVVIGFGLQFLRPVLIPVLLALFVATASQPVMDFCARRRLPLVFAGTLAMVVVLAAISLFVALFVYSVNELSQELPTYEKAFKRFQVDLAAYLSQHHMVRAGVAVARFDLGAAAVSGVTSSIASIAELLTNATLVLLIAGFVLVERAIFEKKLAAALHFDRVHAFVDGVFADVQQYLWIKTWISAACGVGAGVVCAVCKVPNPAMWGLLTFALNFAPMVGSLIASIPPVAIALVMHGPIAAVALAVALGVLHLIIGNIVEPRVMGRRLGLSPLVVFLSMLLWGFLLGPVGALLSTPLTMMLKIGLRHSPSLEWIAVLLGDYKEAKDESRRPSSLRVHSRPSYDKPEHMTG
jgi:predicted PurR-regulated permease PerM